MGLKQALRSTTDVDQDQGSSNQRKYSNSRIRHSSSSDDERVSKRERERRRNDTRWGEKEKKWRDPLLPKSDTVYKDKLSGMLELLKQDADIKRQKQLADNPEKAKISEQQAGKMEKAAMKEPSENRPGDWKCSEKECGNINFAWRKECNNCDAEKPENAQDYKAEIKHEHAEWFVGAVKTEEHNDERVNEQSRKHPPRTLRDRSSSEESLRGRKVSQYDHDHRKNRYAEKKERNRQDRYDRSSSRERNRKRHSYRDDNRRSMTERR